MNIIEKVRFLIYFPKKHFWSGRIFWCSFYGFLGTLEKPGKYRRLNPVKV